MSRRKNLLLTLACAAIIGLAAFIGIIPRNSGFFTLAADFNLQQLPFAAAAWEGVRSGSSWLWSVDLGSSLLTTFSFYNLGSPFFWITLLFPKESFPWLVGFLFILKYIVAAGTAFSYLSRFTKERSAVIGALIYAYSGFQATNLIFYHFHDVVALFPLMLTGLEDYLRDGRKTGFVFSIFLNCLVNYFFFIQEAVFLIIYFLFRIWKRERLSRALRKGMECLLCGVLGAGMAGVLFVPSLLYVLDNNRSTVGLNLSSFFYDATDLLHLVKSILLPGDTMNLLSSVKMYDYGSASAYLPLFGIMFAAAYVFKRRDWLGRLLLLLAVLALLPYGNGLFLLFTANYYRWWYMWTMMMALATVLVLDRPEEYPVRKAGLFSLGLLAALYLAIRSLTLNPESDIYIRDGYLHRNFFLLSAAGVVFLLLPIRGKRRNMLYLLVTCIFCAGSTALTLYAYWNDDWSPKEIRIQYQVGLQLETPDDQYRFNSSYNLLMMPGRAGGYGAFTSTAENESYRFNLLMDCYHVSDTGEAYRGSIPYLPQLLGAKYEVSEGADPENAVDAVETEGRIYYITEREACPIGFAVTKWISTEDLLSIPRDQRAVALMNAFVAEGGTEDMAQDQHVPRMQPAEASDLNPEESIRQAVKNAVSDFHRNGHGFTCCTEWEEAEVVYFTVPYDRGWQVTIDGEKTEIYNSGGIMVLPVPAGEHEISFVYHTPGFSMGVVVSAVSMFAFALLFLLERKSRKGKVRMIAASA